jgi:hypothetical protein
MGVLRRCKGSGKDGDRQKTAILLFIEWVIPCKKITILLNYGSNICAESDPIYLLSEAI